MPVFGKQVSTLPGIFDQYSDMQSAEALQQQYGVQFGPDAGIASNAQANRAMGLAGQTQAMEMYRRQALGQGPSVAQAQLFQQQQRDQANAIGLASSMRGGNLAGMQAQALQQNAAQSATTNQAAAALRAQEAQAGLAGLAGVSGQFAGQALNADQMAQQGAIAANANTLGWYQARRGLDQQASQNAWNKTKDIFDMGKSGVQMVASMLGGATGAGAMSDERAKVGIRPTMDTDRARELESRLARGPQGAGISDDQRRSIGDYEASAGAAREREAQRLSQEIEQSRIAGMQRRYGPPPAYDFSRTPQMMRGRMDSRGAASPDPFTRGELAPGNIDVGRQPEVRNPDGSISTVDSSSYNFGGRETLLPSVTPDGRHLQRDDDIINEYRKTGRHLGQFDTPENASTFAESLHNDYARGLYRSRPHTIDPFATSLAGSALSDERSKNGIRPTGLSASQAIGEVTPIEYQYKNGMGPPGPHFGVSAQQLSQTPFAAQVVRQGPDGLLRVNTDGLANAAFATAAEQEQRLRALEAQAGRGGAPAASTLSQQYVRRS